MKSILNRYWLVFSGVLLIATASTALYLPFLNNGLVFDDKGIFGLAIYDYAQTFSFTPRTFPYFTLGLVHVLTESVAANRMVSLILHVLCALLLMALIRTTLLQAKGSEFSTSWNGKERRTQATVVAVILAAWFALNPVAIYGAAYLAQRTILFATLFSLLSIWFYIRAFRENRTADVITAALFYSAAVLSKEHAIMLPLAVVPFTILYSKNIRSDAKRIGLYLLLCAPAGITAILSAKAIIATAYEPDSGALISQLSEISLLNHALGKWLVSIVTQTSLFFAYACYWLIPDIRSMSVDMRIDFTSVWSFWVIGKALVFVICPAPAIYCIKRGGTVSLFGLGLLYCWLLFFTELVSIRIQEPFVLYRSYLWAPGYAMMLAAVCSAIPRRWLIGLSIPIFIVSFWLARDRLASFTDDGTLWKDAALKLKSEEISGSDRIFYNRGLHSLRQKRYPDAIADFSRAISKSPDRYQIYFQRGLAYYSLRDYQKALTDIDHSLKLNAENGNVWYLRGLLFEQLGCIQDAINSYSTSLNLGMAVAKLKLEQLRSSSSDIGNSQGQYSISCN